MLRRSGTKHDQLLDIGCGYDALITQKIRREFKKVYLADFALNPILNTEKNVIVLEGSLDATLKKLSDKSVDIIIANNVLEHLENPLQILKECRRIVHPEGLVYINVPSWKGKFFLEFFAFRLKLAPVEEMQDHKNYFSKQELWTLVRHSDFTPRSIQVKSKKIGLNTAAIIRLKRT